MMCMNKFGILKMVDEINCDTIDSENLLDLLNENILVDR
jgi:hypothetical protein